MIDRPIRVLIADDCPPTRRGLRALLSTIRRPSPGRGPDNGQENAHTPPSAPLIQVVGEAADGREAVQLVAQQQPDLVLMDVQMPSMNGLDATRSIKDHWPHVRIVVLTIYAHYRNAALAAGADDFLVKGCLTEDLFDAILSSRPTEPESPPDRLLQQRRRSLQDADRR